MVRFVMGTADTAAAKTADKNLCRSVSRGRQPNPALDLRFKGRATDFFSTYLNLSQLRKQLEAGDAEVDGRIIRITGSLILEQAYDQQKQGFFLYREAAETLADCVALAGAKSVASEALGILTSALTLSSGDAHRAAAGALGSLGLTICRPEPAGKAMHTIPAVPYDTLLRHAGLEKGANVDVKGRSLIVPFPRSRRILVLKLARKGDKPEDLKRESDWMVFLNRRRKDFVPRFDIPEPVKIANASVFRLTGILPDGLSTIPLHPDKYAIGFKTTLAYYEYPNAPHPEKRLDRNGFQEVMLRNARILGQMASMGVFHDALIPLFHNRTQQGRRDDRGGYEWVRAGRLDRWLQSCAHPNIGVSGVRDYEHLLAVDGKNGQLYRSMGKQFISLLLLAGSYFRNKDPRLMGLDAAGRPVDARKLFDRRVLKKTIVGIFRNYYKGFTGSFFGSAMPFDPDGLVERMIEEMGVDRHMEEVFRTADQRALTDGEFQWFLTTRGVAEERIKTLARGKVDIVIQSGPHLGAFNAGISLPEIIESAASMAAVCVAGKYWHERYGDRTRGFQGTPFAAHS